MRGSALVIILALLVSLSAPCSFTISSPRSTISDHGTSHRYLFKTNQHPYIGVVQRRYFWSTNS